MKFTAAIIFLFLATSALAGDLEEQLAKVQAQRQQLVNDFKMGQLLMENAQLKDQQMAIQEDALRKQIADNKAKETKADKK